MLMVLMPIAPDVTGIHKSKMAAYKPETFVTRLVDEIASKFQTLTSIYFSTKAEAAISDVARCNRK
jgi:hypothetical protein